MTDPREDVEALREQVRAGEALRDAQIVREALGDLRVAHLTWCGAYRDEHGKCECLAAENQGVLDALARLEQTERLNETLDANAKDFYEQMVAALNERDELQREREGLQRRATEFRDQWTAAMSRAEKLEAALGGLALNEDIRHDYPLETAEARRVLDGEESP